MNDDNSELFQDVAATQSKVNKGVKGIIVGGCSGAIEVSITYPTEYIKTQLQLDEKGDRKKYDGIIDCARKTIKGHGIFGLYRGFAILLFGTIPKVSIRFGAFESMKGFMQDENGVLNMKQRFLAGMVAGSAEALLVVTPMETVKVKFINDLRTPNPKYKGLVSGVKGIVADYGFFSLYQGLTVTVLKHATNQGMRFFLMETMKEKYRGGDETVRVTKSATAIMGCIAGAISVFGNNPMDVVKTRMQGLEAARYKNMLDCTAKIIANEGFTALYKGTLPRMLKISLDTTITFTSYDTLIELLDKVW